MPLSTHYWQAALRLRMLAEYRSDSASAPHRHSPHRHQGEKPQSRSGHFRLPRTLSMGLSASAIALACGQPCEVRAEEDADANPTVIQAPEAEEMAGELVVTDASGNLIYGQGYIQAQSGVVSAADLVRKIPGGTAILQASGNNSQRGFSNGVDRILINGKRISGKQNDATTTLAQIAVDQVARVEVIRGSSPDIKVSSQDSLLNVVLHDDAGGSGSFNVGLNWAQNASALGHWAELGWQDSVGRVDFQLSARTHKFKVPNIQDSLFYDGSGLLLSREDIDRYTENGNDEIRVNSTIRVGERDEINLNAMYRQQLVEREQPGMFSSFDAGGATLLSGETFRQVHRETGQWEFGADYATNLSDTLELKLLGLYTRNQVDFATAEDEFLSGDEVEDDYRYVSDEFKSESIGRASLVWTPAAGHRLELGTEVAVNTLDFDLQFFQRENGELVEQDVSASEVGIRETRDESFLIHSWEINDKVSLDSSLVFEWSKISQSGEISNAREFTYLKPSFDLRYKVGAKDQVQLSVRRNISQLEFLDFASKVTDDNDVIGGNTDLKPEQSWRLEASYERSLGEGGGSIKPTVFYERYSNKLHQIEVSPGLSGVGNAGVGNLYGLQMEASFNFGFVNLEKLQLTTRVKAQKSEITDPFTGETVPFNFFPTTIGGNIEFRYEMPEYGTSVILQTYLNEVTEFRDDDEVLKFKRPLPSWVGIVVEKQVFGDMVLVLSAQNLFNINSGRTRSVWADGRASGALTSFEDRDATWGRRLEIGLKGTF